MDTNPKSLHRRVLAFQTVKSDKIWYGTFKKHTVIMVRCSEMLSYIVYFLVPVMVWSTTFGSLVLWTKLQDYLDTDGCDAALRFGQNMRSQRVASLLNVTALYLRNAHILLSAPGIVFIKGIHVGFSLNCVLCMVFWMGWFVSVGNTHSTS